ncbi:MAG: heme lyase CcmF/NrfE family subunit [Chloroflexi bacterium]|nr:heme lyase CcmF/NrfE family subunit [Chloroflexota bacterium]
MSQIGYVALLLGFAVAVYGVVALTLAAWKGYAELARSGRVAAWSTFGLTSLGSFALIYSLVTDDFSLKYVTQTSAKAMDWFYKAGAMWGGQEGSLLLWAWLLSGFMAILLLQTRRIQPKEFTPWILAIMLSGTAFFLALCSIVTNVFEKLDQPAQDGSGLNPQLQNPGMLFHPPLLYAGYVSTVVAFGFGFAALVTGRLDNSWIRLSRRWILTSWIFLTIGNFLGGQWAYVELGWGGYWAWDPVENAALMPWLITTALLHSIMIQQRRGMFKIWNLSLAVVAYALALFGTFLTRSGVLSSVHAFGESTLGPYFMVWIGIVLVASFGLIFMRMPELRPENKMDGLLSRETSFLFNNILFFLSVLFILWGTLSPLISQITTGMKSEVTMDYFVRTVIPVLLAILFLMGIGPLIAWRRASFESLSRSFWIPSSFALGTAVILLLLGIREFMAVLAWSLSVFTASTVGLDYWRGIRTRRRHTEGKIIPAVKQMVSRSRSRYGGLLVHLGMVVIAIVIIGSSVYKSTIVTINNQKIDTKNMLVLVKPGESLTIEGFHKYKLTLTKVETKGSPLKMSFISTFAMEKDGKPQSPITVASELFTSNQMPNTVVYIGVDPAEDFYISMLQQGLQVQRDAQSQPIPDANGMPIITEAAFQVFVNPLMVWSWVGLVITIVGLMISIWPDPKEALRPLPAWERAGAKEKEVARV